MDRVKSNSGTLILSIYPSQVIRDSDELFFVFEYMERNLYDVCTFSCSETPHRTIKSNHEVLTHLQVIREKQSSNPFSESKVRTIIWQIFQGLAFMHKHGFFHRFVCDPLLFSTLLFSQFPCATRIPPSCLLAHPFPISSASQGHKARKLSRQRGNCQTC